jgi:hypothetical protein
LREGLRNANTTIELVVRLRAVRVVDDLVEFGVVFQVPHLAHDVAGDRDAVVDAERVTAQPVAGVYPDGTRQAALDAGLARVGVEIAVDEPRAHHGGVHEHAGHDLVRLQVVQLTLEHPRP